MSRVTYTVFVAFVASVLTLVMVWALAPFGMGEADPTTADGLREITPEELARHDGRESCWKAIGGQVYDVTDYVPRHPTPESVMLRWCGYEATPGWVDKGGGRPHSRAAQARLSDYLVGRLVGEAPLPPDVEERAAAPVSAAGNDMTAAQGTVTWRPDAEFPDGRYRGTFSDRGYHQVGIQFHLENGVFRDITFRHLYYAGEDYLSMDDTHTLYPVLRQHRQIAGYLEGRPVEAINDLYAPEDVVDDIDGFTGGTLRGSKVISAIRDALNRGIY